MKHVELEFNDKIKINNEIEPVIFNVKATKIADTSQYKVKTVLRCKDKNRSKSSTTIEELTFSQDFKTILLDFLDKYNLIDSLKEELKIKLKKDFKYHDLTL